MLSGFLLEYSIIWSTSYKIHNHQRKPCLLYFRSIRGAVYCFTSVRPYQIFFSATIDGRNLLFGHKLHIGMPYCGKRFWTHQIPTSCLPTQLVFIHIEYICRGIISEHQLTVHLVTCTYRNQMIFYRVTIRDKDVKVNIFDMAGHPIFYEVTI